MEAFWGLVNMFQVKLGFILRDIFIVLIVGMSSNVVVALYSYVSSGFW